MGSQRTRNTRRLAAIALLVVVAGLPSSALAQSDPFGPTPTPLAQQQQPAPTSPSSDDDGLSTRQTALIVLGGAILLFGIGWVILSDAKHRAPTSEEELHGPKHDAHHQARKAQARAKAKRARASRKRNRPR